MEEQHHRYRVTPWHIPVEAIGNMSVARVHHPIFHSQHRRGWGLQLSSQSVGLGSGNLYRHLVQRSHPLLAHNFQERLRAGIQLSCAAFLHSELPQFAHFCVKVSLAFKTDSHKVRHGDMPLFDLHSIWKASEWLKEIGIRFVST